MGQGRIPSRSLARSRWMPVVVSSQPPIRQSAYSLHRPPSRLIRSPPSSTIRWGWQDRVWASSSSYSCSETPYLPNVSTPMPAMAAATSSWVDRGLQPVRKTCAPPLARTRPRLAVLASRCTETATRSPSKGRSSSNCFSMTDRAGIKERTHSIFFLPEGAREASLILLMHFLLWNHRY